MNAPGRDRDDYEGVRRALEERGYLKTPLERIFLDLGGSGWRRWGASLRIAALSGLFVGIPVGILLAGILVVESRGLVPAWPDGVLYAALFTPLIALLTATAELLVAGGLRLLARRRRGLSPRRAALVSGIGMAVVMALYFGLWWAGSERHLGLADLLGLAALVLGAGLSGRVLSAAVLVQAAVAGRAPLGSRPKVGRWLLLAALVSGAAAALAATLVGAPRAGQGAVVSVSRRAPARAVLVGWDGLDRPFFEGVVRAGHAPWLASCLEQGVVAAVENDPLADPAAQWTTLATGNPPRRHGVRGAAVPGLRGIRAPAVARGLAAGPLELLVKLLPTRQRAVRAGVRQMPTFWEITAQARKTAVVGWWGSWPAGRPGPAGGYLVSDGALLATERGSGIEEAIYPGSWGRRAATWLAAAEKGCVGIEEGVARQALLLDLFRVEALAAAVADPEVAVATIYLPGVDIVKEGLRRRGVDPYAVLARVSAHVERVDARLAAVLGPVREGELLAVVGAPGRSPGAGPGWLLLAPRPPGRAPAMVAQDVAPTWLAASGFPVDARMDGAVRADVAGIEGSVPAKVLTRAEVRPSGGGDAQTEAQLLERLRSLGYVE